MHLLNMWSVAGFVFPFIAVIVVSFALFLRYGWSRIRGPLMLGMLVVGLAGLVVTIGVGTHAQQENLRAQVKTTYGLTVSRAQAAKLLWHGTGNANGKVYVTVGRENGQRVEQQAKLKDLGNRTALVKVGKTHLVHRSALHEFPKTH